MYSAKLTKVELRYYVEVLPHKLVEVTRQKNHCLKFDCKYNYILHIREFNQNLQSNEAEVGTNQWKPLKSRN